MNPYVKAVILAGSCTALVGMIIALSLLASGDISLARAVSFALAMLGLLVLTIMIGVVVQLVGVYQKR